MAEPFASPFLLTLATAYVVAWAVNLYAAGFFSRLGRMVCESGHEEPPAGDTSATPVTLVLLHNGEGAALRRLLPAFLEQRHPETEVLLMSTRPPDREAELYLRLLSPVHPELHSRVLPGKVQGISIEALALSLALRTAEHPWVLICHLQSRPAGPRWLGRMMAQVRPGTCFVAGVTLRHPQTFLHLWRLMTNLAAAPRRGLYTLPEDNLLVHAPTFLSLGGMTRAAELGRGTLAEAVNRLSRPTNTRLCLHPEAFVRQPAPADAGEARAEELRRHHATLRFTRRAGHMALQRTLVAAAWIHALLLAALVVTAGVQRCWWPAAATLPMIAILGIRRARRLAVTTRALGLKPYRLTLGYRLLQLAAIRLRTLLAYDISDKNEYRKPTN